MSRTITFKTLDQKSFTVNVQDSDSISSVKEQVNSRGKTVSKLIYSGKVLDDAKTVAEIDIKEKDFVVVMFAKVKPAPKAPEPVVEAAPTPAAAAPATSAPAASTEDAAMSDDSAPAAAAAAPAPSGEPVPFNSQASFVSGEQLQSAIANMVDMGFEREQVMKALRASFNNPDRAVEYLMSGIPAELDQPAAPAPPAAAAAPVAPSTPSAAPAAPAPAAAAPPPAAAPALAPGGQPENLFAAAAAAMQAAPGGARGGAAPAAAAAGGAAGAGIPPDLAALANNPMIGQLREMVQQNPALIQPLIQQLAQSNPALAQQLASNPQALYALLGGADGGEGGDFGEDEWEQGDFGDEGEGGAGGGPNNVIEVTEDERAAIARLQEMGFDRNRVLEAFLLCDRNEEMAANFLFDSMNDE